MWRAALTPNDQGTSNRFISKDCIGIVGWMVQFPYLLLTNMLDKASRDDRAADR
jgi:hypothetical protein